MHFARARRQEHRPWKLARRDTTLLPQVHVEQSGAICLKNSPRFVGAAANDACLRGARGRFTGRRLPQTC